MKSAKSKELTMVTTTHHHKNNLARRLTLRIILSMILLLLAACNGTALSPATDASQSTAPATTTNEEEPLALVPLSLAEGEKLKVAATTSIIGDIVAQIGGEQITLFTLMAPGVDPHSYTPTPQDLRTLYDVDLIFINGLHLEEGLEDLLNEASAPQVSVNEAVEPLEADEEEHAHDDEEAHDDDHAHEGEEAHDDDHDHGSIDSHSWQSLANVQQWVTTIEQTLSTLDPANASAYASAASTYRDALNALDEEMRAQIATIPVAERKLVTDHESFNYFARDYDFTIIGALIPSLSSLAEGSAQELAALQDQIAREEVPAIFVGNTVSPDLAEQIANDLNIAVVPLYSDSLSDSTGPAATYLDFMRYNMEAIVTALGNE